MKPWNSCVLGKKAAVRIQFVASFCSDNGKLTRNGNAVNYVICSFTPEYLDCIGVVSQEKAMKKGQRICKKFITKKLKGQHLFELCNRLSEVAFGLLSAAKQKCSSEEIGSAPFFVDQKNAWIDCSATHTRNTFLHGSLLSFVAANMSQ